MSLALGMLRTRGKNSDEGKEERRALCTLLIAHTRDSRQKFDKVALEHNI